MRFEFFVPSVLAVLGQIQSVACAERTDTFEVLGSGAGSFISQGGIGYNNFQYGVTERKDFEKDVIIPRSGRNLAILASAEGSFFTTGRCFILKSFSCACVAVPYNDDDDYRPEPFRTVPCRLSITAYDAKDKEIAQKTFVYTPASPTADISNDPSEEMSNATAQMGPAKFIRIGIDYGVDYPRHYTYLDDVKYAQYDGSVSDLLACPGF